VRSGGGEVSRRDRGEKVKEAKKGGERERRCDEEIIRDAI
jgi:hypothetical protein